MTLSRRARFTVVIFGFAVVYACGVYENLHWYDDTWPRALVTGLFLPVSLAVGLAVREIFQRRRQARLRHDFPRLFDDAPQAERRVDR